MRIRRSLVCSFGLWFIVFMYVSYSELTRQLARDEEQGEEIQKSHDELHRLRRQNKELIDFKERMESLEQSGGHAKLGPSLEHEKARRKVDRVSREFWYFLRSELKKLPNSGNLSQTVDNLLASSADYQKTLRNDFHYLAERVDKLADWRLAESSKLGDLVQKRLKYLQNPRDCTKASKMVCSMTKSCGFGCHLHHVTYCMIMGYATGRTVILKSKGWSYSHDGWETVFEPISEKCTDVGQGGSYKKWNPNTYAQVVGLPTIDILSPRPSFLPLAVPEDLADKLQRFHGDPAVWWVGQVVKYLFRPRKHIMDALNQKKRDLGFRHPIVGVHIRRTDKISNEAKLYNVDEYMQHVDEWFDVYEKRHPGVNRTIYLASDEPKVLDEAKRKYSKYFIISDNGTSQTASLRTRYSYDSLRGIIQDIHFLSLCDFLVCTFSSQVCRVAYELMQTMHGDASQYFKSLDDIYYFGGQNHHQVKAVEAHAASPDKTQLDLRPGDLIHMLGNHWNGFSMGKRLNLGMGKLFPSYKVEDTVVKAKMPTYPHVT